jgi:hypothetical protein
MAHRAQYGTDLLSSSQDMLTSLDRSAMALNMIAHTLENEFAKRFGHTGVRVVIDPWAAHAQLLRVCLAPCSSPYSCAWYCSCSYVLIQQLSSLHTISGVITTHDCIPLLPAGVL